MREKKKNWKPMVPSSHLSTFYSQLFCFRTMILYLSLRNCSVSPILLSSWEHSSYLLLYSPPAQLCAYVNTELGCRAFTCSSSLPLYIFFSYYTFTYLLYLSVGIQTCRGVPVEVRGWLREGSQSSPSTMWILGSVFKLKSKCLSLLSHLTSSTPVFKMYFL